MSLDAIGKQLTPDEIVALLEEKLGDALVEIARHPVRELGDRAGALVRAATGRAGGSVVALIASVDPDGTTDGTLGTVSIAPEVQPEPPAPRNFSAMICTSQLTPAIPIPLSPTAPMVPARSFSV